MRLSGVLAAAACLFGGANAWLDEGHMLVGAIARSELGPEAAGKLENVLAHFNNYYPGFDGLDTAATWADHTKCKPDPRYPNGIAPDCGGMARFEGIGALFEEQHLITFIWNPHDVPLKKGYDSLPHETGNAPWLINTALKFLRMKGTGSAVSWNLFLRLLIHVVGDIHQPLHTQSSVSAWFDGKDDKGGNKILIRAKVKNIDDHHQHLHKLWDAAGGRMPNFYPNIDLAELDKRARALAKQHPREEYGDRVNILDPLAIAKDSQQFASTFVYKEIVDAMKVPRDLKEDPYVPSEQYIEELGELCEKQVVLAGYRLADILKTLLDNIPQLDEVDGGDGNENGGGKKMTDIDGTEKSSINYGLICLAALVISLGFNFVQSRRFQQLKASSVAAGPALMSA